MLLDFVHTLYNLVRYLNMSLSPESGVRKQDGYKVKLIAKISKFWKF